MSIFYQNRKEHVWFHLSKDHSFAPHLHRQVELIIVLDGALTATTDCKSYVLEAGDGILIFPNRLHSFVTDTSSRILICIFEEDFCYEFGKLFRTKLPEDPHFTFSMLSRHSELALQGLFALTSEFDLSKRIPAREEHYAKGYLTLLLSDLFTQFTLVTASSSGDSDLEQQLLLYIDTHFTEELTLELLARRFGVSPFQISRIFSSKLHMSLPRYVNSRRLEYAKNLLTHSGLSVTQIALDTGFGSARTFFREFQRSTGVSPGEFRRRPVPVESPPLS